MILLFQTLGANLFFQDETHVYMDEGFELTKDVSICLVLSETFFFRFLLKSENHNDQP